MLVILDKDGTLVKPESGGQFVQSPTDQELIPGVATRVRELSEQGASLVIASNQGGVAAGHKSMQAAIQEMQYCLKLLPVIEYAFFCPDFEGNECVALQSNVDAPSDLASWQAYKEIAVKDLVGQFRKPNPGMLLFAMRLYAPHCAKFVYIGDRPEDEKAAQAAGIRFLDAQSWLQKGLSSL
jgi:D-glycero-D-manno-heptose 1,7-bisphosphate phosphatase